jgi:hypothetical protein
MDGYSHTRGPVSPAKHAIVLREHITELRHSPSQARSLFDEVNLQTGIGKVKRGAHTANTSSDHKCGRRFRFD